MVHLRVEVPSDSTLEQVVDQEIQEFEAYFMKELKNSTLTKSEKAILKSWFATKLRRQEQG